MISVDEALNRILNGLTPTGIETVGLAEGLDRILAEDLSARRTQPGRPVSSMDGYAVRSADLGTLPAVLTCIASIPAGSSASPAIPPGSCVRIFTGAPVPPDADSVVIQENTVAHADGTVTITEPLRSVGQWVRPAGLDFREGDCLLSAGRMMGPVEIGIAAAMNHPWLPVHRRPRVAVLATGDEIALPGEPPSDHRLPSSNSFQIMALVRRAGGEPVHMGIVPDDPAILRSRATEAARTADLVVTSGGASVGDHDHMGALLEDGGNRLDFWKIAMRPGKPLMFGAIAGTPLIGLPGNPVSCFVCGTLFVIPAISRLLGRSAVDIRSARRASMVKARLDQPLSGNDHREDYLRAVLEYSDDGVPVVTAFGRQDSSMMSILARSNSLLVRPPNAPPAEPGEFVPVMRL